MVIAPPKLLTYEDYLTEGEINLRYDIIDGVRIFMPSPTENHQDRVGNIYLAFRSCKPMSGRGKAIIAPQDVLITRSPLRVRQPDVLFISSIRHALNRPASDPGPLDPAPELVVEIVSPSDEKKLPGEKRTVLNAKLEDYASVDVRECWAARGVTQTVDVWQLSPLGNVIAATYGMGENVQSITFPDLTVAVADIFAE